MENHLQKALTSDVVVAAEFVGGDDAVQHGVKGMRWGVRRNSKQLKAAAAQRATEAGSAKPGGVAKAPAGETQAQRYSRLASAVRDGQGRALDNDDLNFFNARTEALRKVDALNKTQPSWFKKTGDEVLQNAAKKGMQNVADGLVDKYVTGPMIQRIKN